MKITIEIPDPEKARLFLEYFVPNLPFISEAVPKEEVQGWTTLREDPFEIAGIELREGVDKEQVFAEQGKSPISFAEL